MASHAAATPEQGSFASDLAGMFSVFIDPQDTAKRIFHKWFWVGPILLGSIVIFIYSQLLLPSVEHVLQVNPPPGVTPEVIPKVMGIQRAFSYASPIIGVIFAALGALILWGTSSVFGIKTSLRTLFNLVAVCSLIKLLDLVAGLIIVRAKGDDISTMAALRPTIGLDLFTGEGTNKFLAGLMNFFSIPTIWQIVAMGLIFSYAFNVSKGKAFTAIAPYWLVFLLFGVAGTMMQK